MKSFLQHILYQKNDKQWRQDYTLCLMRKSYILQQKSAVYHRTNLCTTVSRRKSRSKSHLFKTFYQLHAAGKILSFLDKMQGRTQGGGGFGVNPLWAWYFTKTLLTAHRRLNAFAYLLLVNLSICCKHHGMNLHATIKEHCKWAKK